VLLQSVEPVACEQKSSQEYFNMSIQNQWIIFALALAITWGVEAIETCRYYRSRDSSAEGELFSQIQKGHALHKRLTAREAYNTVSSASAIGVEDIKPADVPHDGFRVLQSVEKELQTCFSSTLPNSSIKDRYAERRKNFTCSAGCSAREPQLESSLSPWADWPANYSGLDMLNTLLKFCDGSPNPFIITVLWRHSVHFKPCKVSNISDPKLYLMGPEDLSLVTIFLLGVQQRATLPTGPIVFGMHLSDYTSLVDRVWTGPGVPLFAYLGRDTSWAIPWPSSWTVLSTYDVEQLQSKGTIHKPDSRDAHPQARGQGSVVQKSWDLRTPTAYWIGQVTGPLWRQVDAGLLALPRVKLLRLSHDHPREVKAEWYSPPISVEPWIKNKTNLSGFETSQSRSVQEITGIPLSEYKEVDQWMNYKYYVNVDGVVLGGRLIKLMALGGVVLQHQAGYTEHMYALMKPYVHYVPVSYDLSDLVDKVEWLKKNDAEAKRIAERARALANQRMRLEDHICYIWRALEALGSKTAAIDSNESSVDELLTQQGFKRATMKEEEGMRPTLESFWGASLEDVHAGYIPHFMLRLQWVWDRFEKLGSSMGGRGSGNQ